MNNRREKAWKSERFSNVEKFAYKHVFSGFFYNTHVNDLSNFCGNEFIFNGCVILFILRVFGFQNKCISIEIKGGCQWNDFRWNGESDDFHKKFMCETQCFIQFCSRCVVIQDNSIIFTLKSNRMNFPQIISWKKEESMKSAF